MQHLSYFTLAALHRAMTSSLTGGRLQDAFSQQKDELVLVFRTADHFPRFLRVSCAPGFAYLWFQERFRRAKSNTIDLLPDLKDAPLAGIEMAQTDRLIRFRLGGGRALVLKMHGQKSNVIAMAGGRVLDLFQHRHPSDETFAWPPAEQALRAEDIAAAFPERLPSARELRRVDPRLDNALAGQIVADAAGPEALPAVWATTTRKAAAPPFAVDRDDVPGGFFLLPELAPPDSEVFDDVTDALHAYLGRQMFLGRFRELRSTLEAALTKRLKRAETRLQSAEEGLQRLHRQRPPRGAGPPAAGQSAPHSPRGRARYLGRLL